MNEYTIKIIVICLIAFLMLYSFYYLVSYFRKKKTVKDNTNKKETILFLKYNIVTNKIIINSIDSIILSVGNSIQSICASKSFKNKVKSFIKNQEDNEFVTKIESDKSFISFNFTMKEYDEEKKEIVIRCIYKNDFFVAKPKELLDIEGLKEVSKTIKKNKRISFYYINIIDFNLINHRYGRISGDYVLAYLKNRLQKMEDKHLIPSHMGKDHFAIINKRTFREKSAVKEAKRIIDELSKPIDINGILVELNINIGLVCGKFTDIDIFIHHAYVASEYCKEATKKIVVYDNKLKLEENISNLCKNELNAIIARQKVKLKYSPIYAFKKNKIIGYVSEPSFISGEVNIDKVKVYANQSGTYANLMNIYIRNLFAGFLKKRPDKKSKLLTRMMLEDVLYYIDVLTSENSFMDCKNILCLDVRKEFDVIHRQISIINNISKLIDQGVEIGLIIDENLFYDYEALLRMADYIIIDKVFVNKINDNNINKSKLIELIRKGKEYNLEVIAIDVSEYLEVETLLKLGVTTMSGTYFAPWAMNPSEIEYSKTKKLVRLLGNNIDLLNLEE